jgi:hypothetical protein
VSAVYVGTITPWLKGPTPAMDQLDEVGTRQDFTVGNGPVGCCMFPDRTVLMVVNSLDNSVTELNTSSGQTIATLATDQQPMDVCCTNGVIWNNILIGWFAWITCYTGGNGQGSVQLWWLSTLTIPGIRTPSGLGSIHQTITGFEGPLGVQYDYGLTGSGLRSAFVANSSGDTITKLSINPSGAGIQLTFLSPITEQIKVGQNPQDVCIDPTMAPAPVRAYPVLVTADRGSGTITFNDSGQVSRPNFKLKVPGVRRVGSYWSH